MDKTIPPLKLWIIVLLIVVFLVAGVCGYAYVIYPDGDNMPRAFSSSIKEAIMRNDASGPQKKSIIIFGSSLVVCALPYVSEIEKKISDPNRKAVVLKISILALNMKRAEYSGFFTDIIKYPPDYLFMESNNLNVESRFADEARVLPIDLLSDDLLLKLKALVGIQTREFNKVPNPSSQFYTNKVDTITSKKTAAVKHNIVSFSDSKVANAAYAELIKHKTRIIFLEFPRSPKKSSVLLNSNDSTKLQLLLDSYLKIYGIQTWKYPGVINDPDFFDGVHLNYKGGKKYQDWFVEKFRNLK